MTLLDEAMAAVEAGEVSPLMAGDIYCSVIEACQECFDFRRAQEWTSALSRWCESQPDLVPYRGQCLVRHAELLQLHGDWREAMLEAQQACEWLMRPPPRRAVGAAFYQQGELHRLRGALGEAEEAYRQADHWGRRPDPGLAMLRLAQGQVDAAAAAIRRSADEAQDRRTRSRLLPAYVEIVLATGDLPAARTAADELAGIADDLDAPLLRAVASQMQGAVPGRAASLQPRPAPGATHLRWPGEEGTPLPLSACPTGRSRKERSGGAAVQNSGFAGPPTGREPGTHTATHEDA
jgi:tetratricopeptide (TPR) repeat protein